MKERNPRVLVVDDDFFIAMDVEHMVGDCGCATVGPVSSVAAGVAAVQQQEIDGAVLDVNLGGERVWPLADLLLERGILSTAETNPTIRRRKFRPLGARQAA